MNISVKNYFNNKNIFLTGGTGFLGKIFLEKILKCEPRKLYLLIRPKKDVNSFERFNAFLKESPCFEKLRMDKRENFENFIKQHIHIIEGDISKKNLGISDKNYKELCDNVDLVINAGASVSWKENIAEMINTNLISALYALDIAKNANADHYIHISTMSTIRPLEMIYKKNFYGSKFNFEDYIENVKKMNNEELDKETKFIHENYGSTYAFVKAGSEKLIEEKRQNLTATIIRSPSLGPTYYDPVPGWLDNITGYTGNYLYIGLGKSKAYLVNKNNKLFEMPVDIFANYMMCISKIYSNKNEFNTLSIIPDSNITIYNSMIYALNYFKSYPVPGIQIIDPIFFENREEFTKYIKTCIPKDENDKKLIQRTKYFNNLYLQANFYDILADEKINEKNKVIQKCSKKDSFDFPLVIPNFDCKYYVELSCQGLKKYIIKY